MLGTPNNLPMAEGSALPCVDLNLTTPIIDRKKVGPGVIIVENHAIPEKHVGRFTVNLLTGSPHDHLLKAVETPHLQLMKTAPLNLSSSAKSN